MDGAQTGKLRAWPRGDHLERSWTCEPGHRLGLRDRCFGSCHPLLSLPDGCVFAANLIQTVLLPRTLLAGRDSAALLSGPSASAFPTLPLISVFLTLAPRALLLCLPIPCLIPPR